MVKAQEGDTILNRIYTFASVKYFQILPLYYLKQVHGLRLSGPQRHSDLRLQSQLWIFDHMEQFFFFFFLPLNTKAAMLIVAHSQGQEQCLCMVPTHPIYVTWTVSIISPSLGLDSFPFSPGGCQNRSPELLTMADALEVKRILVLYLGLWFPISLILLS